jgi:hypothetical protein
MDFSFGRLAVDSPDEFLNNFRFVSGRFDDGWFCYQCCHSKVKIEKWKVKRGRLSLYALREVSLFVISNDLKLLCNFFRMVDQLGKTLRANHGVKAFVTENE